MPTVNPRGVVQSDIQVVLLQRILASVYQDMLAKSTQGSLHTQARRLRFAKEVEEMMTVYRGDMQAWADITVPNFYKEGMDRVVTEAIEQGIPLRLTDDFVKIHKEALNTLITSGYTYIDNIVDGANATARNLIDQAAREAIIEEVAKKRVTGEAQDKLVDKVESILKAKGVTTVTSNGRTYNAQSYAKMLSRTLLTEAQWNGTRNQLAMDGHDLVIVSDHFGECKLCRPYENEILSVNGMYPQYTRLDTAISKGLKHSNCLLDWNELVTSEGTCKIGEIRNGATIIDMEGRPTKIVSKMVRDYKGVINTIFSGDFKMAGTPNHSTLTEFGWTFFEDLRVGQKLIQNDLNKPTVKIDGRVVDSEDFVSFLSQKLVFSSVSFSKGAISMSPPVTFNNYVSDNEVGNVKADRHLEEKFNIVSSEDIHDDRFILVGISPEIIRETIGLFLSDFDPVLVSTIIDEMLVGLASRNFEVFHDILYRSWGLETTHMSDLFRRFAFFVVDPSQKGLDISKLIFNLFFGSYVHIDKVSNEYMETKVYDIQTDGTYLLSNGIISHNCRHVIDPYYEDFAKVSKVWDAKKQKYVPWEEAEPQNYNRAVNMDAKDKLKAYESFTSRIGLDDYQSINKALNEGNKESLEYYARKAPTKRLTGAIRSLKKYI